MSLSLCSFSMGGQVVYLTVNKKYSESTICAFSSFLFTVTYKASN